ncbi:outer membrane beta-barrel protein [Spirosoma rigui]|uniref:outer membrane beta-barrel protein n=1 Tax=Spirosoma rigui TaxID=564064 RepID=UPI0009AFFF6E|nr:outer membrane beta-barrel protein [Spirosoma rigui]
MKSLFTFLFFLLTLAATAQSHLTGTVVDNTGQPLSYATVALLQARDSSVVRGALTDESGRFVVTVGAPGTYRTRITSLGFSDLYTSPVSLEATTTTLDLGRLPLSIGARQLGDVTVKAQPSLFTQQSDRIIMNVEGSVLTRGNKVDDLLRYMPRVRYDNGTVSVGNKSNVLILVDGRQMGQASLAGFLQTFSAEDILRLEVITNPSARYDATVGAVINIITRKSREQGINGRVSASYSQGQYGRSSASGSLNYRQGKWNLFGSLNTTLPSTAYSTQLINRTFPNASQQNDLTTNNTYRSLATSLGIDYAVTPRHTVGLRLNGKWGRDDKYTTTLTRTITGSGADSTLRTLNDARESAGTYDLNLNYKGQFGPASVPGGPRELTVYVTESILDKDAAQLIRYQTLTESQPATQLRILNPNQQRNLIGQLDFGTPILGGRWHMDLGAKYVFIRNNNTLRQQNRIAGQYVTDPIFSQSGTYQENTYAAYTTFSRQFGQGWSLQGGLRAEHTQQSLVQSNLARTYTGLFPSLGVNRSLAGGRSWGVTLSRKVSRPGLNSLVPYRYLIDPYTLIQGNPAIRPTFAHTLDAFYALGSLTLFANYSYNRDPMTNVLIANEQTGQYTQIDANLRSSHDVYTGATYAKNISSLWQTNTTLMVMGNLTDSPVNELARYRASGLWLTVNSTNIFSLPHGWNYELTLVGMSAARSGLFTQKAIAGVSMSLTKSLLTRRANLRVDVSDVFRTLYSRLAVNYGSVDFSMRSYNDSQRVKVSFSYNFGKKTIKAARQTKLGNEEEKSRMGR